VRCAGAVPGKIFVEIGALRSVIGNVKPKPEVSLRTSPLQRRFGVVGFRCDKPGHHPSMLRAKCFDRFPGRFFPPSPPPLSPFLSFPPPPLLPPSFFLTSFPPPPPFPSFSLSLLSPFPIYVQPVSPRPPRKRRSEWIINVIIIPPPCPVFGLLSAPEGKYAMGRPVPSAHREKAAEIFAVQLFSKSSAYRQFNVFCLLGCLLAKPK